MIWFCYFCKRQRFFFWAWPMGTLFLQQLGQKVVIFGRFSKKDFRTTGFKLKLLISIKSLNIFQWKPAKKIKLGVVLGQNLGQIKSNVVKKNKETGIINDFFSCFT